MNLFLRLSRFLLSCMAASYFFFSQMPVAGAIGVQTSMVDGLIQNYILHRNDEITMDKVVNYAHAVIYYAHQYGVDPLLVTAMIACESNFDQSSISSVGAIGLAQLMPDTAEAVGVDPYDPIQNIEGGCSYLSTQMKNFAYMEMPAECALAAYNAGPNAVKKYGGIPPYSETMGYVSSIRDEYFLLYDSLMYAVG